MLKATLAKLGIGFAAGVLWLTFLGIPIALPSYMSVRIELAGYADLEEEAVKVIGDVEDLRAEENENSVDAVNEERESKGTTIDLLIAENERLLRMIEQGPSNEESTCSTRDIIDARELFQPSAEIVRPTDDR